MDMEDKWTSESEKQLIEDEDVFAEFLRNAARPRRVRRSQAPPPDDGAGYLAEELSEELGD